MHLRFLLKRYYGVTPDDLNKVLYETDASSTLRFQLDRETSQDKPNYIELVCMFLSVTATNDNITLGKLFERLEKQRSSGILFHTCPGLTYLEKSTIKLPTTFKTTHFMNNWTITDNFLSTCQFEVR